MRIEDLINQHRESLDCEEVPPHVWSEISTRWKKTGRSSLFFWRIAATVLLAAILGLILRNRQLETQVKALATLGDISKEYAIMEAGYKEQIDQLETELSIHLFEKEADYQWIFDELKILEEVNQLYQSDLEKVTRNQLVPTLIDYYEKKIKLLKRLELEIKRQKRYEKNETINTMGAVI